MYGNVDSDSRRSERKPLRKAVVLVVEMGEESTSYDARTLDVSEEGARIQVNAELKPGQVLHLVRPENPDETVTCLVVWTADVSSDKKGEAGLEFLKSNSAPLES
jgi:PilZ domain